MTTHSFTRQDRVAGFVLLGLAMVALLVPGFDLAGRPDSGFLVGSSWFCAATLLLSAQSAPHTSVRWTRPAAAILFVMGLAGPFVANLIDSSLGA